MNRNRARRVWIPVVILALVGAAILLWRSNGKLRGELMAMQNELAQAREDNARLQQGKTGPATQSGVDHLELLRLRNRIAELGRELRQNTAGKSSAATESAKQVAYPFLKTAVTNRVPYGQTLVLGGWTSPNGKRAFVIATPAPPTPDGQPGVHLWYQAVQAEESFWDQVGWGTLKSDGENSVAGLLTPEQAEALLQALKQTKKAELANRMEALLVEGDKATFGWSTTDGGGSTLLLAADILARPTPDRQSIDLEFRPAK